MESQAFMEYYQPVFHAFSYHHRHKVKRACVDIPWQFRRKFLFSKVQIGVTYSPEVSWDLCKQYLDAVEAEMRRILAPHSVFYWLSLARRIRPGLPPAYDNDTGPHTSALVFRIMDLAIRKFGDADRADDLALSTDIGVGDVLGGHFKSYFEKIGELQAAENWFSGLATRSQWIIKDFSLRDYLTLPRLEGLAYEYWRATAAMRTIGKGSSVVYKAGERWFRYVNEPANTVELISSYDRRIGAYDGAATLLGTWHHSDLKYSTDDIISVHPNVQSVDIAGAIQRVFEIPVEGDFVPNFMMDTLSASDFWRAHQFMSDHFASATGLDLAGLILTLWALSNHVQFPNSLIDAMMEAKAPDATKTQRFIALRQLLMRGYVTTSYDKDDIAESLSARLRLFRVSLPDISVNDESISKCIEWLTLTKKKQSAISLWSGGPYLPVIPYAQAAIIDIAAIRYILQSLFYKVRDDIGKKGGVFENEFRTGLTANGFTILKQGEIYNSSGDEREIDASVRIGDTLYLLECLAKERPLDFEIGQIKTISCRTADLTEKLDQANTLRTFISSEPTGRNYDFSWAKDIKSFVVSPFVEWIWAKTPDLWDTDEWPRILAADECIAMLKELNTRHKRQQRRSRNKPQPTKKNATRRPKRRKRGGQ